MRAPFFLGETTTSKGASVLSDCVVALVGGAEPLGRACAEWVDDRGGSVVLIDTEPRLTLVRDVPGARVRLVPLDSDGCRSPSEALAEVGPDVGPVCAAVNICGDWLGSPIPSAGTWDRSPLANAVAVEVGWLSRGGCSHGRTGVVVNCLGAGGDRDEAGVARVVTASAAFNLGMHGVRINSVVERRQDASSATAAFGVDLNSEFIGRLIIEPSFNGLTFETLS